MEKVGNFAGINNLDRMKLYIKNMVCNRCKMAVQSVIEKNGLHLAGIDLGEVEIEEEPDAGQLEQLDRSLEELGFERIDDRKSRIIEKIKNTIVKLVHYSGDTPHENLSQAIAHELHYDYNYLSALFSEVEGTTIEKYFIAQKIERVKELLVYDELTLSEIAYRMGYSSVAHLSNQFKKVTGFTPSHFKTIREKKRTPLDKL